MYFNRYKLEHVEEQVMMHFCFVHPSGMLLDRYSSIISQHHLRENKSSTETYLQQADIAGDIDMKEYPPTDPTGRVDSISFIQLSRLADIAEVGMVGYSMQHLVNATKRNIFENPVIRKVLEIGEQDVPKNSVVLADTIALLRCGLMLQKRFIIDLLRMIR